MPVKGSVPSSSRDLLFTPLWLFSGFYSLSPNSLLHTHVKMFSRGLYAAIAVGILALDVVSAGRRPHLGSASHRKQERAQDAVRDATHKKFLSPRDANSTSRFLNNATESQYDPKSVACTPLMISRIRRRFIA